MIIETKELRFPISPEAADELLEAVSNAVGGPQAFGKYSASDVIQIVKDLLLEPALGTAKPRFRQVTIVNGPQHGEKFDMVEENGITLNIPDLSQPLHRYPKEADIRYSHTTFMSQYFILGDFAYYIGQRIMAGGPLGMPHLDAEN